MSESTQSNTYLGDPGVIGSCTWGGTTLAPPPDVTQSPFIHQIPQAGTQFTVSEGMLLNQEEWTCLDSDWFVLRNPDDTNIADNIRHRCSEFDGLNDSNCVFQLNDDYWDSHLYICDGCHKPVPDTVKIAAGLAGM